MVEFTVYKRTRIKKDGTKKELIRVKRYRKPIVIVKKDGVEHIVKKSSDMKMASNPLIEITGHVEAKNRMGALMKAFLGLVKGGNNEQQ